MGTLVVLNHLTLDGVMQAPGRPDEDMSGGFTYGGWARPRGDAVTMPATGMGQGGALLFGRKTYEDFYSFWPNQANNPFTDVLNHTPKYVASATLREPLPWSNSTLVTGNVAERVARLKEQQDLLVMGSGELLQSLMQHNLVDRYVLMIHPITLGAGKRLFREGGASVELRLIATQTSPAGVIVATYEK